MDGERGGVSLPYLGTHASIDHTGNLVGREDAERVLFKVEDRDEALVSEATKTLESQLTLGLERDIVARDVDRVLGSKVEHLAPVLVVVVGEDTRDLAKVGGGVLDISHGG